MSILGQTLSNAERLGGNRVRPWKQNGYSGERCGRVRFAVGPQGALLQLSGAYADRHATAALELAHNVSRIDLAITARMPRDDPHLAKRLAVQYDAWRETARRPPKAKLVDGRGDGDTLYIGRRTSERYLRVYDKQRESGDAQYTRCWRVELELKGHSATPAARSALAASDRMAWIESELYDYLRTHGLSPWWDRRTDHVSNLTFRRRSDTDGKLRWVANQVMPTLRYLAGDGLLSHDLLETVQSQLDRARAVIEAERQGVALPPLVP